MGLPVGSLENPPLHDLLLGHGEVFVSLGRGHDLVGIGGDQKMPEWVFCDVK